MRIINFLWHFSTGGIGKCFLIYDKLGELNKNIQVKSVCVILDNIFCDYNPLIEQGVEIIHIKNYSDFTWMGKIKDIVKKEKPDAFFCHGFNGPILLYLLHLRYKIKVPMICTCHGVNLDKTKYINKIIGKVWMSIYRSSLVKKIICVEKFTPPMLFAAGIKNDKVVTVYNGIDAISNASPIDLSFYKVNGPIIITASRLTRIKGLNYLFEALRIIKDKGLIFHYFCIGNGEEEEFLKELCNKLGLNDVMHFMGYQNNVPEWLAACDIFVLPSLEEFHSIAILEAMRAKKAIVATSIGGNPESLRDEYDALMVPAKDPNALAEALERLICSPELRERLSQSANERFKKMFTVDVMMKNLAKQILSVQ